MFMLRPCSFVCSQFIVLIGLQAVAHAQDSQGGSDCVQRSGANKLERVEIAARPQSDTELRRRAPIAKQIYGREEVEKFGDASMADVLKRLPGITAGDGGVRLRGLGSGYTQVLLNGEPVPPGFQLDQLNPSLVERVEVSKAGSAEHSAQAVAGSINIILKDAPRVSQRDLQLRAGYNADRPTGGVNFTWSEKEQGGLSIVAPLSVFEWLAHNDSQSLSYMPGTDGRPALGERTSLSRNWGHGFNASPRVTLRLGDEEMLTLQLFLQGNRWNFANAATAERALQGLPVFSDDVLARGESQMARLGATYAHRIDDESRVELRANIQTRHSDFDNRTQRAAQEHRVNIGDTTDRGLTQSGKYSRLAGEQHTLTAGWELERRKRDESRTTTEDGVLLLPGIEGHSFSAEIDRQAAYLQDEWEISPQLSTYLGVRGERIATRSRGDSAELRSSSRVLTPMWHLNYKLDPKASDLIRASLTRSYKAPTLDALLGRAWISNLYPDLTRPNDALSPDRVGNPDLKPELATGFDLAYENYFKAGGMASVGVFYRRVDDMMRNRTTLRSVGWAQVQRWVSMPENISRATTAGLEFEFKGRGHELLPFLLSASTPLTLNASISIYRSRVDAVQGPNNRLDGQQPWSATIGADYRLVGLTEKPITLGGSVAYAPQYSLQQTSEQGLEFGRYRSIDVFAMLPLSQTVSMRLLGQNLWPMPADSRTIRNDGYYGFNRGDFRPWFGVLINVKL